MAESETTQAPLTAKQISARANLIKAREKKAAMAQTPTPIETPPVNNEPIFIPKSTPINFWEDSPPKKAPTYFWTDPEYQLKKLNKKREREEVQLPPEAPPEKKQQVETPPVPDGSELEMIVDKEHPILSAVVEKGWGWAKVFLSMFAVACLQQITKKMAFQVAPTPMEVERPPPRGNPRFLN